MCTWSQRKIYLFQRITVKTVWKSLSFKLLYFGFFRHLQSKGCDWYRNSFQEWGVWNDRHQSMEVAESQKVLPGVGHMKRQAPEGGSAEPRWATWAAPSWVKRDLFYLLRANRGSGARQSREPLNHGKSHTHAKVSVRKSRSPPNPVGNSTERREEEKTGGSLIPGPSSTRPTVHPPSQTGHKFPFIKCRPREDSPRPGDRLPAWRATESPRQKNLRTPEN